MSDMPDESYGNDPVCPHCGHRMQDAWELNLEDGEGQEHECGECFKTYYVERHVSVNYTSKKVERVR